MRAKSLLMLCLAATVFTSTLKAADQVLITEFMASNSSTLRDEDNTYPDWVEIYNAGTNTVNLNGWFLTDNAGNLTKWQFPATNLVPHSFMVVFASGKNRRVPGAPLHTSFSLSADGEYLGLVRPDGVTIASQFAPQFPDQFNDVAYGYTMTGTLTTLLPAGAGARALVPSSDIGPAWRGTNYDDTGWTSGTTGVGYDQGTNYTPGLGLNLGAAMSNVNASAYVRVPFNVPDPNAFKALTLRMRYDDGFVAYLNGTEVARRNAPGSPDWNSTATTTHGPPPPGLLAQNFEGGAVNYTLNQYQTGPAPAVQPAGAGSTGGFLRLLHDGVNAAFNAVAFDQTAPGLFETIVADFDFRMANAANNPADGWAFMLIPTKTYGTNGPGININNLGIEEPNFADVFAIGIDVYPHDTQNDVSVHWNAAEKLNVTMPRATFELVAGVFHHLKVTLRHVTGGARVTVTLTPNVNGTPGAPYTPISDLFVAGLNPYDCRVQIGGRTGGLNHQLDLDNLNVQFIPPPGLIAFEDFDVTPSLGLLAPGANVLAVQGLNVLASDPDFLITPEIVGADFVVNTNADYIAPATPGTWNNVAGAGAVSPVTFSQPSGAYTSNTLTVALASSSSSAQIRYTVDGSTPNANSALYSTPITITTNTAVRARGYENGKVDGEITAANYVLIDPNLTNFTSNLPLVIIDSLGGTIVAETKIPTYVVLIDTNGPAGRTRFDGPFDFCGRAGVELHGQSSLGFPKQSMNLETDSEKDKDKKVSLLGMPKGSDWVLYAPYTDKTLMNDFLTYELHEAMGHYAVRRRFVEVFVRSAPGKLGTNDYRGVYVLLEKIRIDENRVDISEPQSGAADDPITGGYIFKRDKGSPGMVEFTTLNQPYTVAANGVSMQYHDPRGDQLSPVQRSWLTNYLNEFETALYGPNWRDPQLGYLKYIDPDSFVDQHWIVEFPKNIDGYRLSDYMHKDRGGKIKMEPIWDWNLSWGNANYLEGGLTNGWYHTQLGGGDDIWLSQLRKDPDFYQRIIDRWGQLRTNVFALSNLLGRVDRITNQLWEAQARDFARWPRLGAYVWPNPDGANLVDTSIDGTTAIWHVNYATPGSYTNLISEMKKWIRGRHAWIDARFVIAPEFSLPSGMITPGAMLAIAAPTGSVYYTLDGSDPRGPGGAISAKALPYSGAIQLTANAGVMARAFYTNSWSPPASAVYVVATPTLAISEIMYHPADAPTNSPWNEEDFEFIEIKNTGPNSIDLQGARLAGGINYTFRPEVLAPTGGPTGQNFDGGGTPYTASVLNSGPAPAVTAGGPSGSFLRLISSGLTNLKRNRITFDQTASGPYGRVTADFDFRASTVVPPSVFGSPTTQYFDGGGTAFTSSGSAVLTAADAGSSGSFLRLVPAANSLTGGLGLDRTAPGTWNTVTATFDFRITPGTGQADGMGFALLNTGSFGANGASPAIGEEPNLANSIGVGIDVYSNAEINNNHVSLHWNGAIVGAPATPPFDLSNGQFHRAKVIVRFSGGRALVTVRITPDINGTPGAPVTLFQDAPINGVNPYESRLGFGARTGGENAAHDVDNVSAEYSTDTGASAGLSMLLLPASQFGTTGAGSTLAHFTDGPAVTNALSLDLAFNASNTVNDVTLYFDRAIVAGGSTAPGVLDFDSGAFHHASLVVERGVGGGYVTLTLTPNGSGTPVVVASNLFVSGLSPENARMEFAARNGGLDTSLDLENVQVNYYDFLPLILAPGECILVVKNRAAFESRYGTGFRIAGEYTGQLANSGDHIVLLGPVGEPIMDFRYSDDWFRVTDGLGFSLVNRNPSATNADYNSADAWRSSSYQGGSPGSADPFLALAPIVVNEVLANSVPPEIDRIELYNPTTNDVNIGGWYLTDDFQTPKKFRIPNGTILSQGAYAVFTEDQFNPLPGSPTSFALGSDGDEVWLFSGNETNNLTGYVHGFDFGASEENVSLGRYLDSTGEEHFPAQIASTFGATNAGPRVGPVVISEIMYHPPDVAGQDNVIDEFIELANISAGTVPLYSTNLPTDTWRLRDAVDFDFPMNISLSPGERVLVVNFDPTNAAMLAAFRAAYHVDSEVQIFGPYSGKLDNSGDSVELNKPLPPGTNGTLYARVDKVAYKDSTPWPSPADGYGPSLHRVALNAFGNDPGSWTAALPTGGLPLPAGTIPAITAQPVSVSLIGNQSTYFSVSATGPDLHYQWRVDGQNVADGTNAVLTLANVQISQAGQYRVAVFNTAGSAISSNATLTVLAPVLFTIQPASQNVLPGTNVTLVAQAVGNGPVRYQWHYEGVDIPDATNASYSFNNASLASHGTYQVTASDALSSSDSQPAFIFVLIRPGVVTQPLAQSVVQGGTAVFSLTATGAPPLYFRWLRNGVLWASNDFPELVIPNCQSNGSYRCQIVNAAGNANSSSVALTVLADFDGDGIPDAWEKLHGFNTNNATDGLLDTDGDGMNNHDEYVAGTDPLDANSVLKIMLSATSPGMLQFVAQASNSYAVQWRTNLSLGDWQKLTNLPPQSQVRTVEWNAVHPPSEGDHFYRVITPLEP